MLAAVAVLALIMVILTQSFTTISSSWKSATNRGSAFANARAGFEALKLNLSQATLNTYVGYADANGVPVQLYNPSFVPAGTSELTTVPNQYVRASELHFITGPSQAILNHIDVKASNTQTTGQAVFFQAPVGFVSTAADRPLNTLVNVMGYYIAFNSSADFTPTALTPSNPPDPTVPSIPIRWRYRLMEVIQPAENNGIYYSTCENSPAGVGSFDGITVGVTQYNYDLRWIGNLCFPPAPATTLTASGAFANTVQHPLADNIIAMALLPKLPDAETAGTGIGNGTAHPLANEYTYDSRLWETGTGSPHPFTPTGSKLDLARWRNQLPPILELVIIAIDETSAQRLENQYGNGSAHTPPFSNSNLIQKAGLDLNADVFQKYKPPAITVDTDIAKVETALNTLGVSYRIFHTDVALNNSQWSSN